MSKASGKLSGNSSARKAKSKTKKRAKTGAKHEPGAVEAVARAAGWVAGVLAPAGITPTRDLFSTIHKRRSHKRFKPNPVDKAKLHLLLDAAVMAPNHKMTEPWGFLVLGPRAQHVYADAKARLKFGDHMGVDGKAKAEQLIAELLAVPVVIGVTQKLNSDPVRREEDYAAVFMAVQNLLLAGTAMGLGTKVHTGSILDDAIFRAALGLTDGERLVTVIHIGEPEEELPPKKRAPAADKTRWLD